MTRYQGRHRQAPPSLLKRGKVAIPTTAVVAGAVAVGVVNSADGAAYATGAMSLQTTTAVSTWNTSATDQAASRSAARGSAAVDAKVKSANAARSKAKTAASTRAANAKAAAKKRAALAALSAKTTAKTYVEQPAAPTQATSGTKSAASTQSSGTRLTSRAPSVTKAPQAPTRGYTATSAPASTGAWTCPIAGCGGVFTSGYGFRVSPGGIGSTNHKGVDLSVPSGTPLRAIGDATVAYVGWYGGQGMRILLDFGNGVQASYAHMSGFAVATGQRVSAGQVIGFAGSTGNSTGPHLHLEILIGGVQIDPVPWLSSRGIF